MYPQTEFEFILPKGLIDAQGQIHRQGVMRLARARDEIEILKNQKVQNEPAYEVLMRLSQVITVLGSVSAPTPEQLEHLFSVDLTYLQEFYNRVNYQGYPHIPVQCPHCQAQFEVELTLAGEC